MAEMLVQSESLVSVADAIRAKGGTSDALAFPDGFVSAISAIQGGGSGGGSVKDFYFSIVTNSSQSTSMFIPFNKVPDVLVMVGPLSSSNNTDVGIAIHIKDADGGIYQEKWRYQSTDYLVGTSATDGSLFTLLNMNNGLFISIKSNDSSYGSKFCNKSYKVFAAKMF